MRSAKAFSPSGISSFFEICDTMPDGKPITDLERVGARGGGFGIQKGVTTRAFVSEAETISISVMINGRSAPEAETTKTVVSELVRRTGSEYKVVIEHEAEAPVGAGFGSSAAGALGTALALSSALGLHSTFNELGRIAHVAEVRCKTGLGTVGPLMIGGCILTLEPGAPGIAVIDRIPVSPDSVVVAGTFGTISTKAVLSSVERRLEVNKWGRKTLENILGEPSLENFLDCCLDFAEKTRFMNERLRGLVKQAKKAGAIGAAQNMVGEAVHAVTTLENVENLVQAFKKVLPPERILMASVDLQGARLIG